MTHVVFWSIIALNFIGGLYTLWKYDSTYTYRWLVTLGAANLLFSVLVFMLIQVPFSFKMSWVIQYKTYAQQTEFRDYTRMCEKTPERLVSEVEYLKSQNMKLREYQEKNEADLWGDLTTPDNVMDLEPLFVPAIEVQVSMSDGATDVQ